VRTHRIRFPKGVSLYARDTLTLIQKQDDEAPVFWSIRRAGDKSASIFGICATKGRSLILTEKAGVVVIEGGTK